MYFNLFKFKNTIPNFLWSLCVIKNFFTVIYNRNITKFKNYSFSFEHEVDRYIDSTTDNYYTILTNNEGASGKRQEVTEIIFANIRIPGQSGTIS